MSTLVSNDLRYTTILEMCKKKDMPLQLKSKTLDSTMVKHSVNSANPYNYKQFKISLFSPMLCFALPQSCSHYCHHHPCAKPRLTLAQHRWAAMLSQPMPNKFFLLDFLLLISSVWLLEKRRNIYAATPCKHRHGPKWPNTTFFGNFQQKNTVSEINDKVLLFIELEFQKLEFLISSATMALLSWDFCD